MATKSTSIFSKNEITSLAIGRFDGLHLGHQALFDKLDSNGAFLIVDTCRSNLTPIKYLSNIANLPYFVMQLESIKNLSCEKFVSLLKDDFKNLKKIIVGEDFRFGKDRSGGTEELIRLFENTEVLMEVKIDSIGVHSRYIRNLLLNGNVVDASRFLGRYYRICGDVIKGQGIGSKNLYSTINMDCKDFFLPQEGVYVTKAIIGVDEYRSVSFIGHRVCTDGNYAIETHILDDIFKQEESLCIDFCTRLRGNMFFENLADLKRQIESDISEAKTFFDKNSF